MKTIKIALALCALITAPLRGQNVYGEFTYGHSVNTQLSCGVTATNNQGFVLAGYNPSSSTFNFCIDRTSAGGAFVSNAWEFQEEYQIFADPTNCIPGNTTQMTTCHGVSIIESQVPGITAEYAVAGAYDQACFLTFLDINGAPINSNTFFWRFPSNNAITKPLILEDPSNAGNYFICGSYNNTMYAIFTDINGGGVGTWTYPISGQPRAMTLSASGNPVIVGKTTINGDVDGFVIELNATTGAVNLFSTFDAGNLTQEFSCIAPMASGGYVIGGICETASTVFRSYVLKVNATVSTITNQTVITANADKTAGNFVGIYERTTGASWGTEYAAVMSSTAGIIVENLYSNLQPMWSGSGYVKLGEFQYNAPGASLDATGISFFNTGASYDEGMHIFGTDNNSNPTRNYLAKAYFSGESGCNSPSYHFTSFNPGVAIANPALTPGGGLTACNVIYLTNSSFGTYNAACGPYSSVSNASNQRQSATKVDSWAGSIKEIRVFPNPTSGVVHLSYLNRKENIDKILVRNSLGQLVSNYSNSGEFSSATGDLIINFEKLNIESGIYFVEISSNGATEQVKVVYNK